MGLVQAFFARFTRQNDPEGGGVFWLAHIQRAVGFVHRWFFYCDPTQAVWHDRSRSRGAFRTGREQAVLCGGPLTDVYSDFLNRGRSPGPAASCVLARRAASRARAPRPVRARRAPRRVNDARAPRLVRRAR